MSAVLTKVTGNLQRSFLRGRDAGEAVVQERGKTVSMLTLHGLEQAARATSNSPSFKEYFAIRSVMLQGGPAMVRKNGGRTIDRR